MLQAPQRLRVDVRAAGDTMTVFHPPQDITAVERVVRWFLSVPQWVQLTGAVLAIIIAMIALVLVWRNASAIREWMRHRHVTTPLFWKAVIGLIAVTVLLGIAGSGATFFVYSQNENQFCLSCHTLHDEVYQRFQQSKHHRIANLRCHDCHDEPLVAEMTQVAKWMLLRPSEVGPHAPVPRAVCAGCHVRDNPDSTWQRIIATAGHSVHLATDTAKKLGVECLTCHGVTTHRFVPVAQTCSQSGCHKQMDIKLGKMAGQTSLHCTTCHQFTAPVSEAAGVAAAREGLMPGQENCLGCHEMRRVIERFVPANDPHKGQCGACHNPHSQTKAPAAYETCASSGCHARPDTLTPFHRGIHTKALANCATCHQEHTWKVQGKTCLDCHQNIFKSPPKVPFRPPARTSMSSGQPIVFLASAGDLSEVIGSLNLPQAAQSRPAMNPDSVLFSHATHRAVSCGACHSETGPTHGTVTLRSVRDCARCHHETAVRTLGGGDKACLHCHRQDSLAARPQNISVRTSGTDTTTTRRVPFAHATHAAVACSECHTTPVTLAASPTTLTCARCHHETAVRSFGGGEEACLHCHRRDSLPARPLPVSVQTSAAATAVTRLLPFAHATHARVTCAECHTTPVTLAAAASCSGCHQPHHAPQRDCRACHAAYDAHRGQQVHLGCGGSGCHTDRAALALGPARNVCVACHAEQVDHKPGRDCASCHRVHWVSTTSSPPGFHVRQEHRR